MSSKKRKPAKKVEAKELCPSEKRFVANALRLRKAKNLSQSVLAEKVGVSVSYVSMLERGFRSPPLPTLDAMAKALGVKPGEMLS